MTSSFKSTLIIATAATIALTSFDLRPAFAQNNDMEFSSQQQWDNGDAAALAAFGMIAGAIAGLAMSQQNSYQQPVYGGPHFGPYGYPRRVHRPHVYQRHVMPGYQRHWRHGG